MNTNYHCHSHVVVKKPPLPKPWRSDGHNHKGKLFLGLCFFQKGEKEPQWVKKAEVDEQKLAMNMYLNLLIGITKLLGHSRISTMSQVISFNLMLIVRIFVSKKIIMVYKLF